MQRELDGTRQDELLARILRDGAAEFVLLERHIAELLFDGAQRGANPCGAGADDAHVRYAGDRPAALDREETTRDRVHAVATFIDRVLDEREPAQLTCDEHVGDGRLVLRIQLGHVRADARTGHDDRDRTHGARLGAEAVADALVTIDDRGLARDHGEHVPLRADLDARAAADALRRVDVGVLGARPVGAKLAPLGGRLRHGSGASEEITTTMTQSRPVPDRRAQPPPLRVAPPERPSLAALAPPPAARRPGRMVVVLLVFALVAICVGGARYYLEPMAARVRNPWHAWLKPSGYIGQSADRKSTRLNSSHMSISY